MNILDATMSMLEMMPEDARIQVFEYTYQLFLFEKSAGSFIPLSEKQLLCDLSESREQILFGRGKNKEESLKDIGKKHEFI